MVGDRDLKRGFGRRFNQMAFRLAQMGRRKPQGAGHPAGIKFANPALGNVFPAQSTRQHGNAKVS